MQSIVYLSFGDEKYKYELLYNLKSFFKNCKLWNNQQIVIICDEANLFIKNGLVHARILIEEIPKKILEEWFGKEHFLFRIKIKAIEYVLKKYKGSVLYLDTDVVILSEVQPLLEKAESNIFLLNTNTYISKQLDCYYKIKEFNLVNHEDFKYLNFLKTQYEVYTDLFKGIIINNYVYKIDLNFNYCNAGCIGVNEKQLKVLEEVCKLSDELFARYQYELSEELAFNIVFQKQNNYVFIECEDILFHYSSFEFKICRLLSGYIGKVLSQNDYYELQGILEKSGIKNLEEFDLKYANLSNFVYFLNEFGLLNRASENAIVVPRFMFEKELRPLSKENLQLIKKYYKIYKKQNLE